VSRADFAQARNVNLKVLLRLDHFRQLERASWHQLYHVTYIADAAAAAVVVVREATSPENEPPHPHHLTSSPTKMTHDRRGLLVDWLIEGSDMHKFYRVVGNSCRERVFFPSTPVNFAHRLFFFLFPTLLISS
jgi:hypothetical protein